MRRRRFLQLTGGAALAFLVVGCGDSGEQVFLGGGGSPITAPAVLGRITADGAVEVDSQGRYIELLPSDGQVSVLESRGNLLFTSRAAVLPYAAAVDESGRVFVLDRGEGVVLVLGAQGNLDSTIGQNLQACIDLAVSNGEVFLLDPGRQAIDVYSLAGTFARTLPAGSETSHLRGIAAGPGGELHVLVSNPVSVQVLSASDGQVVATYGPPDGLAVSARGLSVNGEGRSAILDHVGKQVLLFDQTRSYAGRVTIPDDDGDVAQPLTLCLGPDGLLSATYREVV